MQKRELRNAVGTHCGSKDDLLDTEKVVTHLSQVTSRFTQFTRIFFQWKFPDLR